MLGGGLYTKYFVTCSQLILRTIHIKFACYKGQFILNEKYFNVNYKL